MKLKWLWVVFFIGLFCECVAAERMSISAPVGNVRSGPDSEKSDILWKVEQYYPIEVLEKKGLWFHFKDFEGDQGWVHSSLVGKTPSVITVRDKCNVRSGPGTGSAYSILFTVEKGVPFKVLGKKEEWLNVQHGDGDKGWVHQSLIW